MSVTPGLNLPHAEVCTTTILPHATAYNRAGAPAAMARIARALDAEDALGGLFDLAARLGAKLRLSETPGSSPEARDIAGLRQ